MRVAARKRLNEAVIACGLPHIGRGDFDVAGAELKAIQPQVAGLRRMGAAALDLAWVAAGRFDGFWERNLSSWDMAAGMVLVREAGGFVSDASGGDKIFETRDIVAGNDFIQRELVKILKPLGN
jgi:myo-inositol-1(or 4)-monophosphatase